MNSPPTSLPRPKWLGSSSDLSNFKSAESKADFKFRDELEIPPHDSLLQVVFAIVGAQSYP